MANETNKNNGQTPLTGGQGIDPAKGYRYKDEKFKYVDVKVGEETYKISAKTDVEFYDMDPKITKLLGAISKDLNITGDLGFDIVLTSAREGQHTKGSRHYIGEAIDLRTSFNYRGDEEGVNTPWDDPLYKYFEDGNGKKLMAEYGVVLNKNLEHGDAPHLHIQTELSDGGFSNEGTTRKQGTATVQTNKPFDFTSVGTVDPLQISPAEFTFLYDMKNQDTAVEEKVKSAKEDQAKLRLLKVQKQRQDIAQLYNDFQTGFEVETPKRTTPINLNGILEPNTEPMTEWQDMESISQYADGGTVREEERKRNRQEQLPKEKPLEAGFVPEFTTNTSQQDYYGEKIAKQYNLPHWNDLPAEHKNYIIGKFKDGTLKSTSPHMDKASKGQNYNFSDEMKSLAVEGITSVPQMGLKALSMPQAAMVETIEAARGNEYDFNNITGNQRAPSDTFLKNAGWGWQLAGDILLDPTNIVGAGVGKNLLTNSSKKLGKEIVEDVAKAGNKVLNKTDDVVKTATSSVDDVNKSVKPAWQMQELPGLHLKSTMEGEVISKIVEPKTGLINTEQALAIIGKESGGADKVALIRQGLGNNIPKKMDYNKFRKTVQDQLIPLEKQFSTQRSSYGVNNLGYDLYNRIGRIKLNDVSPEEYMPEIEKWLKVKPSTKGVKFKSVRDTFEGQGTLRVTGIKPNGEEFDWIISKSELPSFVKKNPHEIIENQTLILGNKDKFGKGSSAHGNPEETLGHAHFLRDAESPDVLTVTQIQSDAFQGSHRIMPKSGSNPEIDKWEKMLTPEGRKELVEIGGEEAADLAQQSAKEFLEKAKKEAMDILGTNPIQKQLLDKNHQERYLQELVDYAGKRGDVNKVRVPTSETAAKVQGYSKNTAIGVEEMGLPTDLSYSSEHQTILKKYSEQPKTIKKLFGIEPKVVTDSKGNTWYEFDIPKKFKDGKGEIKALGLIPPAIGIGATALGASNTEFADGGTVNKIDLTNVDLYALYKNATKHKKKTTK